MQECFHLQFHLRKLFVLTVRCSITVFWIKSYIEGNFWVRVTLDRYTSLVRGLVPAITSATKERVAWTLFKGHLHKSI